MKKLILIICALTAIADITCAQIAINKGTHKYVPFHQYLSEHKSLGQNNETLGTSVPDYEIAFRHDTWIGSAWVMSDSGSYAYNTMGLETNNTICNYSTANEAWYNSANNIFTYDQAGDQLTNLTQTWNTTVSQWVNVNNTLATFNSAGKPLTFTYQVWGDRKGWQNTYNFIYTYDNNNNLIEQEEQVWSSSTGTWVNTQRSIQKFTPGNLVLSVLTQSWDPNVNDWVNYYQWVYSYDNKGNQIRGIYHVWQASNWVNFFKDSTVYDANKNVTALISQAWDTAGLTWHNKTMLDYTFDNRNNAVKCSYYEGDPVTFNWSPVFTDGYTYNHANMLLTEVDSTWNASSSAYVNSYKAVYTYDQNNNTTGFSDYYWGFANSWVPNTAISYTIDANNKTVYELDQVYDQNESVMVNTDQYYFYYTIKDAPSATGLSSVENELGASLYPNPTSGNINIVLTLSQNTDITLNTFDAQGRLIYSEPRAVYNGTNDMQVNCQSLSSGTYYMQLIDRANDKISVVRFVKTD